MSSPPDPDVTRRDFLVRGGSFSAVLLAAGAIPLRAEDKPAAAADAQTTYKTYGPPVNCAVVGCGVWGRELLKTLALLPNAPVVAVCDTYEPMMRRAGDAAPKAEKVADYRKVMENKDVKAVLIATPTHLHPEIAIAALKAGKHVYCEAPLAATVEDARAIAQTALAARKLNFQAGLQYRSDVERQLVLQFVRGGTLGKLVMSRAQWHRKQSWRRAAPTPEREQALNWRLEPGSSAGLIGEVGVHHLDMAMQVLNARPVAVTGFGGVQFWKDGRTMPDTVQAVIEFPEGVNVIYNATLGNSFDSEYEMIYGSDAAVMIRENKAWMFKEVDAPLLGWEVHARKEPFYKETGITLKANASKQAAQPEKPAEETALPAESPLYQALEAFVANTNLLAGGVEDFIAAYGDDDKGLADYLRELDKKRTPAAGAREAFEATVVAIRAHETTLKHERTVFRDEWFNLG